MIADAEEVALLTSNLDLLPSVSDAAPGARGATSGQGADLSGRQREVLGLLAEGLSARAIAVRLGITETTTRNHIHALLQRLGCHSQLEAVARARQLHLL